MNTSFLAILFFLVAWNPIYGQSDYPPCVAYTFTTKDTLKCSNSYSNTLYVGIENEIVINKSYFIYNNIKVQTNNGIVILDEDKFYLIPQHSGVAVVSLVFVTTIDTSVLFVKKFEAKQLPQPFVMLGGTSLHDINYIRKDVLLANQKFKMRVSFDIVDDSGSFKLKEITLGYKFGKFYMSKSSVGDSFSKVLLNEISKLPPGKEITLVFKVEGEGGVVKNLEPIRLKLY